MILSVLEFRGRFTQEEKRAIYTAAETVIDIRIWLDDLMAVTEAEGVDTTDERTVAGVQGLEEARLIDKGRALEILGAEGPAAPPVGGFTLGQAVKIGHPFTKTFPDVYKITGFGPNCVEILDGSQFDISFIEAV
jgi:hypothetical protein